jgi:hypothetical protein
LKNGDSKSQRKSLTGFTVKALKFYTMTTPLQNTKKYHIHMQMPNSGKSKIKLSRV